MGITPETHRIEQVYRRYQADSAKSQVWSPSNSGNRSMRSERLRVARLILDRHHYTPLANRQLLEIGCGDGNVMANFQEMGAAAQNLYGVDLLAARIEAARELHPDFHFEAANAEQLRFQSGRFDLVLFFTVFSSILDKNMRARVAGEATRVLQPGGGIIWYDFRFNNPWNRNVRGVSRQQVQGLFPGFEMELHSVTVLPPLARRLGRATNRLYPLLASIPLLRTHYVGVLIKP